MAEPDLVRNEQSPLSMYELHPTYTGSGGSIWDNFQRIREMKTREELNNFMKNRWYTLLFGQLIALIAASQNAASFTLEFGMGKVFPFFLMFHMYVILSLHLWFHNPTSQCDEAGYRIPMTTIQVRTPWWYYIFLSILDVTPNYLQLLSLKHTSLTSSNLLGSLTAPSIMISCHFLLGKVYRPLHFLGASLCVVGGILTMWTDLAASNSESEGPSIPSHPHSYFGDILAVTAAVLYGLGDALGELWCKHIDRKEYLGMLGFFGAFWCCLLIFCTEYEQVLDLFRDWDNFYPAFGIMCFYVPTLVLYYVSASFFLVTSDATLLNLSLQSSNLWAICFSVVAFQEAPSPLFYIALVLVVSGVFVYELLGNESRCSTKKRPELSVDYQPIQQSC